MYRSTHVLLACVVVAVAEIAKDNSDVLQQRITELEKEQLGMKTTISELNLVIEKLNTKFSEVGHNLRLLVADQNLKIQEQNTKLVEYSLKDCQIEDKIDDLSRQSIETLKEIRHQANLQNASNASFQQRLEGLEAIQGDTTLVAFSSFMSMAFTSRRAADMIPFDSAITNIGNAFSNGVFTCPVDGIYVFAWTIFTNPNKLADTYLQVNNVVKSYNNNNNINNRGHASSGSTVVLQLKSEDKVFITSNLPNNYYRERWSSFQGWLLRKL